MTNYREILRLHSLGLNKAEIASSCRCARNTVAATLQRAANCGLQWPLPEEMSDKQLSERLFPSSTSKPVYKMPDYASVHKELQRSGVTLNLLWLNTATSAVRRARFHTNQPSSTSTMPTIWQRSTLPCT